MRSGEDEDALLAEAEAALVAEATGDAEPPGPSVAPKVPAVHRRNAERGRRRDAQLPLFPRRTA